MSLFVMGKAQNCPSYNVNGGFEVLANPNNPPFCNTSTGNPLVDMSVTKAQGWNRVLTADMFGNGMTNCVSGTLVRSGNYSAGFSTLAANKEFIYTSAGTLIPGATYIVKAYFRGGIVLTGSNVGIWMIPASVTSPLAYPQLANPTWTPTGSNSWYCYQASFTATTGTYSLWVGSVSSYGVYISVDDISLTLNKPTIITITNDGPKCYPNCVNIGANVTGGSLPLTYAWSNGFTTQGQAICTPTNQIYAITVTDKAGCTITGNTNVVVNPKPTSFAGPDVVLCGTPNSTTNYGIIGYPAVCGRGNYTYSWSPSSGLSSATECSPKAFPGTTTLYTLTTTDPSTGCSGTDQVLVTVTPPPCNGGIGRSASAENIISEPYPNPSNGEMQFNYNLAEGQQGELAILDLMGKQIDVYKFSAGQNVLEVNAKSLLNGIYMYRVTVNNEIVKTDKFSIIK